MVIRPPQELNQRSGAPLWQVTLLALCSKNVQRPGAVAVWWNVLTCAPQCGGRLSRGLD